MRDSRDKKTAKPKRKVVALADLPPGKKTIAWIEEYCRIPEGPDVGQRVKLRDWQRSIIMDIYANPAGTRRAILSFGRKNAKTSLAAFILLYHLCGEGIVANSHIYSAAQSRDQAGILFELAAKIVRLSPTLAFHVTIKDTAKELHFVPAGTRYKALSAEVSTAFGLSPVLVIHDELGQVRGPRSDLYDALETATAAHRNPMSIIISTQAPNDADLLSMLIDDALAKHDPHTIIRLFTTPMEIDPFSEEAIKLANPAYGDFQNASEVRAMAANAKRMPASEAGYRNLVLNQRISASTRFIAPSVWTACGGKPEEFDSDTPVYAGLDLSAANDLTACVMIGQVDGVWQVHSTFWLPADGLAERSKTDRVPYDMWAKQGFLQTVPGSSIEYEYVARWLRDQFDRYRIVKIAFDRWNFSSLKAWLLKSDFDERKITEHFVEFRQGFQSMSPALRELESLILNSKMAHGNHPVLTMCADASVVVTDPQNNRKLSKQKSTRRIDGMVALAMAVGIANLEEVKEPSFEMFVLS
jgi:phage terminase large subunit-like protein